MKMFIFALTIFTYLAYCTIEEAQKTKKEDARYAKQRKESLAKRRIEQLEELKYRGFYFFKKQKKICYSKNCNMYAQYGMYRFPNDVNPPVFFWDFGGGLKDLTTAKSKKEIKRRIDIVEDAVMSNGMVSDMNTGAYEHMDGLGLDFLPSREEYRRLKHRGMVMSVHPNK